MGLSVGCREGLKDFIRRRCSGAVVQWCSGAVRVSPFASAPDGQMPDWTYSSADSRVVVVLIDREFDLSCLTVTQQSFIHSLIIGLGFPVNVSMIHALV